MVVAYSGEHIQAVARIDESTTRIRVATVVGNPDPTTRQPGAGQAILAWAARAARETDEVPKTVYLQAANKGLVPYYERLGFERT